MRDPTKKRYLYGMLAGFGAISLNIILFFIFFQMKGIGEVLNSIAQILSPFIYGGVVAYLLRPLCNSLEALFQNHLPEKQKGRAGALAVLGSLITMVLIIYALIAMVVPQVYDGIINLWNALPSRVNMFLAWAESTFGEDERMEVIFNTFNTSYEKLYVEMELWIRDTVMPQVTTVIAGVGSSMFKVMRVIYSLLVGLIVAVYLLHGRKRLARQSTMIVRSIFPEKWAEAILNEVSLVDRMFGGFIDAKILDSAIIGVLCYLGCSILRMPNTFLVSIFVGVTNVIPFFGPFIGAVPATLLILMEDPLRALWFVIFVVILQQLDGNVIGPRIMGNRIGISGFWVMFAIIFFGGTWGVAGMVVGVPLFAVIYDLLRKLVKRGLRKKGRIDLWEEYTAEYPNEDLPTAEPEQKISDWTLEDWKTQGYQLLERLKKDSLTAKNYLLKAWAFAKKWAQIIWSFLKKWAAIAWQSLRKWWAAVCVWVRGLCDKLPKQKTK